MSDRERRFAEALEWLACGCVPARHGGLAAEGRAATQFADDVLTGRYLGGSDNCPYCRGDGVGCPACRVAPLEPCGKMMEDKGS